MKKRNIIIVVVCVIVAIILIILSKIIKPNTNELIKQTMSDNGYTYSKEYELYEKKKSKLDKDEYLELDNLNEIKDIYIIYFII